jgi:hypothetical protein
VIAERNEREHSLMRLSFALCLASTVALLGAQGSLRAEEVWPEQPKGQWSYMMPGFPPFGYTGERFRVQVSGGYFFKERKFLDKFNEHRELAKEMVRTGECLRFLFGHKLTALENIWSWRGRVHDEQYGDGYLVFDSF